MGKNLKDFGILVPIVTPCSRKGEIDRNGLLSVCADMVQAGCRGIFVMGSTGRGPWFSRSQQIEVCHAATDYCQEKIPVFSGCMATGLEVMIENAMAMADAGAQIAVVTAPGYFHYNQDEVQHIFMEFADGSPLPVLIYDIPGFAGIKLNSNVVESLSNHGNIIGLKDSSADMDQFRQLIGILRKLPNFYLFQGKEHLLADSLIEGASGFVVSLLHIDPRPFVLLDLAARSGQASTARKIQTGISRLLGVIEDCFKRRPETSTLFHILNAALIKRKVCSNILLEHEGECPAWLAEKVDEMVELCSAIADGNEVN
jgi:4-hydroxy-tetrahydrodipicolinate synthase